MSTKIVAPLALLFVATNVEAKPLYLTVHRAYSTTEPVLVDLAFSAQEPVELRLLQPEDPAKFIRSQVNLRRMYELPPTQVNPGRYLSRGLNAWSDPSSFLLNAMDPKFRLGVSPALPERVERGYGRPVANLAEGTPKLVGLPPGMKQVKSQWLNLDLGGSDREFTVPGFEYWSGSSGFQDRRVSLGVLPAGIYVVQMVQGRIEGQVLVVVSDLTVQVKQTDGSILVRVAGRDQKPKQGAQVTLFGPTGKGESGSTNEQGEVILTSNEPKLVVTVQSGKDIAVADTDFYSSLAVVPDCFIYSDRPIYRPGDEAQFRGVIRRPDSALARLFNLRKPSVKVWLQSDAGNTKPIVVKTDEFGSFSGKIAVPAGLPTGVLRLVAELDGREHQSEARVQEYVKPTFYLEVVGEQDSVRPGDTIKATVRARRYAGGVPTGAAYEVFLYRTVLDTPQWVDDAGMGATGSSVTYGSKSTNEGTLSIPKRLYSSVEERSQAGNLAYDDPWASAATFDEEGNAEISVTVPELAPEDEGKPFKYTLTVRARDPQDTFASKSKVFFFAQSDVMGTLISSARIVMGGETALLAIRSTSLGGKAVPNTKGKVEFQRITADGKTEPLGATDFVTDQDGVWRGAYPKSGVGTVRASVVLRDAQERPWASETSLRVAGTKGEAIAQVPAMTLEALAGTVEPGEQVQLVALFPDNWGPGGQNQGNVWITYEGAKLYETKLVNVAGQTFVHELDAEGRFGSAVYVSLSYPTATGRWEERVVPIRILPTERTLHVTMEALSAEAKPLGTQTVELMVSNADGDGVEAQVSISVVDQAVYAIQQEFRPGILEFFYPLVRNNVTSFYSVEFQGYGYGDYFAWARGKLSPYSFAAVKPPTKKQDDQERDTAYWTANLKTDERGRARVTFDLPSNQTLWTVTAVAADTSGRFGEGTTQFATRGAMNIVASMPQLLRVGDEAQGSVRFSRGDKPLKDLSATLTTAGGLAAATEKAALSLDDGEQIVPVRLSAKESGDGRLELRVSGSGQELVDRRSLRIEPGYVRTPLVLRGFPGNKLVLNVPNGAVIESAELVLEPSSVELALSGVRDLLDYPCCGLIGFAATLVPNVAVYRVLSAAGGLDALDAESRALLAEARGRATYGVNRILSMQVKKSGFTWFNGYNDASVPLTLLALDALAFAADAQLVARDATEIVESADWLAKQENLSPELDATRVYVLARLRKSKQAPEVRALLDRVAQNDPYAAALAVLAAHEAGVATEMKPRLDQMAKTAWAQQIEFEATPYWAYPVRKIGLTAILAHAVSTTEPDVEEVRQRLFKAVAGEGYLSIFDWSSFLLHSAWLLERDAKMLRKSNPPTVSVNGKSASLKFGARGAGLAAKLEPDTRSVEVGGFDGLVAVRAMVQVPIDAQESAAEGMSVTRKWYRIQPGGLAPIDNATEIKVGEELFVELSIDARKSNRWRSAYFVLRDPIPAGLVAVEDDKRFQDTPWQLPLSHQALKRRALSPGMAELYFEEPTWWSESPRKVGYVVRAQFAGQFSAPSATVHDLFDSRIYGRSESATLKVIK